MRFSTAVASIAAFAAGTVVASPCKPKGDGLGRCLPRSDVDSMVSKYVSLVSDIGSMSESDIDAALHPDFVDWSNSIDAFFGTPYDTPVFPTKEAFVAAQQRAQQAPIELEGEPIWACDKIVLIWRAPFAATTGVPSRGISIVSLGAHDDAWKISRIDVEFNSLAWAYGVGGGYKVFQQEVGDLGCDAPAATV